MKVPSYMLGMFADQAPGFDQMSMDQLQYLRNANRPDDKELQNYLADYEHRAFAREEVQNNPLMALSLLVGTPAYAALKTLGLMRGRSDPSLRQIKSGLLGTLEGLKGR
jgi:hypothetical protein